MFFVFLFCEKRTHNRDTFVTRDKMMYNCSWKKIDIRKSTFTIFNDWSCVLFTIMTKQKRIENCFRRTIHDNSSFVLNKSIREINRISSSSSSLKIRVFNILREILVIIIRVSLQRFCLKYKFRKSITSVFIFKHSCKSERKDVFNVRKNFASISSSRDSLIMLSTTFNVCISFCNDRKIISFNCLIVSLCIIKTIWSLKEENHDARSSSNLRKRSCRQILINRSSAKFLAKAQYDYKTWSHKTFNRFSSRRIDLRIRDELAYFVIKSIDENAIRKNTAECSRQRSLRDCRATQRTRFEQNHHSKS